LNLALLQANAAQLAAAEQSFKKALELDPKSVTAMLSFGNFYQQQKRNPDAEVQYRKAMQTEPANSLPVVALGRLLLIEGRRAEAEQLLKDAKKNLHDNPSGYRLLGDFYFGTGDLPRATEEFASLVRQYPKDQKLKSDYIQLLILSNRLDEATKLNDEILKDSPKDIPGQVSRGQILLRQGKTQEAIQQLQAVISVEPDNAVAQYHLGLAFAQTGNLARAEVAWREAVRLRPGMASAQQGLAQLAIIKGNNDLLMESANALINIDSSVADGYLLRALARANRQDLAGAEADLRIAMAQAPADPTAYARLATIRAFQKKYPEAEKLYEQSLEKNPNFFEAMQGLVAIYAVQKQPQKALTRVQGQIAKAPSSALYVLLGQLYATQNQLDEAEAAFTKAMSLDKKNVEAYFLLAQLQTARGSLDKAAQSYEQSILQAPQEIRSYVSLGMLEEKRHNFPRARELYEKALRVQPDASNPWAAIASNNLAYLLLENGGNADVALSLAQTARQNFPKLPNFADTLAWVYYRKGAYGSAVDLLKSAIHDAPNNASAATFHYHLGMAYDKINDKAHAREELERALQLDPKIENAQEIRQVLSTLGG
jgi:tetratricopeptide (TPR) repeat protein